MFSRTQGGFRLVAVFLTFLLAVTMLPAAGMQTAFADEPGAAATTDATYEGLLYKVTDNKATLVGFEDGASLEGDIVVPETVDGATVTAVEMAEGQVAEGITSLTLPQTVASVKTEGLASAFPSLASIEVDGTQGVYSTSGGMLFLQGKDAASSDGSTTLAKNRELVWAPPALVVARLPIECKSIAAGAFMDAASVETVMCPGVMESIAVAEKDEDGNVTKPGAFTDEQIASLSIVVPGTNIASPVGDRVSASVALSEDEGMEAKREAWWKHGFDSDKIVMGTSFGEVEGVVAVSDEGTVEDPSIDVLKPYEKRELAAAAESGDEEAAARLAGPSGSGLSFSYNADMNLSVSWAGDRTATPASVEIPAYVAIDGVKYAVTEIAPEAFKGAVFLTSVAIPEGVRIIGESAFEGCSNLKEVALPSTLKTIDYAAFKGTALESVIIPDGTTYIGGEAFAKCIALKSVQIGNSTTVGANVFLGSSIESDAQVASFQVADESVAKDEEQKANDNLSGNISVYAAPSGPSQLNTTFYDYIPTEGKAWGSFGFITSKYYTIYYYYKDGGAIDPTQETHKPLKPTAQEIYENGSVVSEETVGKWNGGFGGCFYDISPVMLGLQRCMLFSRDWHGSGTNPVNGYITSFLVVPQDDVFIKNISFYDSITGGYPENNWKNSYAYATFTANVNALSVVQENQDDIELTPRGSSIWTGNGSKARYTETFTVSSKKPGYSFSNVTVTGEGTTYDAATNTLTMGWADSTVSATLIPNDINVAFAGERGGATGVQPDRYGGENIEWDGDAASLVIKTDATVADGNQTTVTFNGQRFVFANGAGQTGCAVNVAPNNGWEYRGDWVLEYRDGDGWVKQQELSVTQSATIDYTKQWRITPKASGRTYTVTYDPNGGVADSSQWPTPPSYTSQNGDAYVYTDRYTTSAGPTSLAEPKRAGFWFAGWKWTNAGDMSAADAQGNGEGAWYNGDVADDPAAKQFEFPAGAYGNANLVACWKPKMYEIDYDVTATRATDDSGNEYYMSETPASSYFAHPNAKEVVEANATYDEAAKAWRYTGGSDEAGGALHEVDLSFVEPANLDYTLPDAALDGFACAGWTKDKIAVPGNLPTDSDNYSVHTQFSAALANRLWPGAWDATNKEDVANGTYVPATNKYTMFGAWTRVGQVNVVLGTQQPHEADTDAGGTVTDGLAVKGSPQTIEYWKDRGLFVYDELKNSDHTVKASYDTKTLATGAAATDYVQLNAKSPQFKAIGRTGFRFLGWGTRNDDGTPKDVYLRYYESAGSEPAGDGTVARATGFYLTPAGMAHVLEWEDMKKQDLLDKDEAGYATETWEALWEIRSYDVTLRLPAAAVTTTSVDLVMDGGDSYGWREMSGNDAGWYEAKKRWSYWDVIDVPRNSHGDAYGKRSNFYTYEGWYLTNSAGKGDDGKNSLMVESEATDGTFRVMESAVTAADGTKTIVDFGTTGATTNLLYGKTPASGEVTITAETVAGAGYAAVGSDGAIGAKKADGETVLWLNFTPVIINVTAPVGVFLAGDEPYVVGSDPRKHLETEAKFTVRESTHNLVLTGVTATDVKDASVDEAERNRASWTAGVTGIETAAAGEAGLCSQLLSVPNQSADASVTGTTAGDRYEDIYNSRVFWVSPTTTVDAYDKASQQTPGTLNTATRRYFGFGLADGDNKLFDDPDAPGADPKKGENDLSAFTLKMPGLTVGGVNQGLTSAADAAAGKALESKKNADNPDYVDFKFYYGLDLRKCDFNLGTIQTMIDAAQREAESGEADEAAYNDGWQYNQTQKVPLVRLMFTFAVERQELVSYSARFGSTYDANAANAIAAQQEVPEVTFSGWEY